LVSAGSRHHRRFVDVCYRDLSVLADFYAEEEKLKTENPDEGLVAFEIAAEPYMRQSAFSLVMHQKRFTVFRQYGKLLADRSERFKIAGRHFLSNGCSL
jgi:hypothetical protein